MSLEHRNCLGALQFYMLGEDVEGQTCSFSDAHIEARALLQRSTKLE